MAGREQHYHQDLDIGGEARTRREKGVISVFFLVLVIDFGKTYLDFRQDGVPKSKGNGAKSKEDSHDLGGERARHLIVDSAPVCLVTYIPGSLVHQLSWQWCSMWEEHRHTATA